MGSGRATILCVAFAILLSPVLAQEPSRATIDDRSVRALRAASEYDAALAAARELLAAAQRAPEPVAWQVESLHHLVGTLEAIAALPAAERGRLAAADRLEGEHRRAMAEERFEAAAELAQRQLALQQEILGEAHLEVAATLCTIGLYLDRAWTNPELGESSYRRCLAIRRERLSADHPGLASALHLLGLMLRRRDSWEESEALMRKGLDIRRRVLGADHLDTASSMHHLSVLLVRFRRYEEARQLAEQALAVHRRQLGYEDRLLPENLVMVGLLDRAEGRNAEAEGVFREALELTRQRVGDDSWYVSWVQTYIGSTLVAQGKYAEADLVLVESEQRLRRLEHLQLFQVLQARGQLALTTRDYEKAIGIYTDALAWERKLRGNDANYHVVNTLMTLARVRFLAGQTAAALHDTRAAVDAYEAARLRVEAGFSRARFADTPHIPLAILLLEADLRPEAWRAAESGRGRILADSVRPEGTASGSAPVFDLERVQSSLDRTTAIVGWLDFALPDGSPRFWGYVIRDSGPVLWERLDDLGVEAGQDPQAAPRGLRERLNAYREEIARVGEGAFAAPGEDASLAEEARALGGSRFAPLERHLRGVDRLVIVSSWAMSGVPVETLETGSGAPVGDRYTTTYAPSATMYAWLVESAAGAADRPATALLVGDPPFRPAHLAAVDTDELEGPRLVTDRSVLRGVLGGDRGAPGRLPRLPWSRKEVNAIARWIERPLVLVGSDASEERLLHLQQSGDLATYDVVHLATHAVVDNTNPEKSALVLSQVETAADGLLTLHEILTRWELDARLVTLSACETGLGENLFGEGLVGFAYTFLEVGADSLLASLWRVDDRTTTMLMERFYGSWLGTGDPRRPAASKADALREAKRWLRAYETADGERPYAHPYFWSGFVLIGDPR